jgi:hypothetical protein
MTTTCVVCGVALNICGTCYTRLKEQTLDSLQDMMTEHAARIGVDVKDCDLEEMLEEILGHYETTNQAHLDKAGT